MKKILLAAVLLFSLNSKAQVLIGMGHIPPAIAGDTILPGHASTDDVWIKNLGTTNFNDIITVQTAVRDSISPTVLDGVGSFSTGTVFLAPGDSVMISLSNTYNVGGSGNYRYGIDVIVVWPVAASAQTIDSLEFSIYIMEPTGIGELDVHKMIKLYPNPSSERISVDFKGNAAAVEQVTIYDMEGRIVLTSKNESCIDIHALAPGIYTVDVLLSGKKHYSGKFLKQKNGTE